MGDPRPADPARFFTGVLADQHYQKGLQYEQQGDWEHALAAYRRASALDLNRVLFLLARGRICQSHGLEAEAEECYRRALTLRPDDPVVLFNQAQLHAARGQVDEARACLTRIVDGDVDELGERAAPIFCRLGDLALRRRDMNGAALYFARALTFAPNDRYAATALAGLDRFAEFEAPFTAEGLVLPKVALYGFAGAVVLGMPDDDGIDVPSYPGLGFDSLDEVAHALARFVALARRAGWHAGTAVALDADAAPLTVALADALDMTAVHRPDLARRGERVLAIGATGSSPAAVNGALTTLRERCEVTCYYSAGLREVLWEYDPAPHVITVPVRLEFPWNRGEAGAPEHAEAIGSELAALLARVLQKDATALNAYVDRQMVWYRRHPRLALPLDGTLPALLEGERERQRQLRHA